MSLDEAAASHDFRLSCDLARWRNTKKRIPLVLFRFLIYGSSFNHPDTNKVYPQAVFSNEGCMSIGSLWTPHEWDLGENVCFEQSLFSFLSGVFRVREAPLSTEKHPFPPRVPISSQWRFDFTLQHENCVMITSMRYNKWRQPPKRKTKLLVIFTTLALPSMHATALLLMTLSIQLQPRYSDWCPPKPNVNSDSHFLPMVTYHRHVETLQSPCGSFVLPSVKQNQICLDQGNCLKIAKGPTNSTSAGSLV